MLKSAVQPQPLNLISTTNLRMNDSYNEKIVIAGNRTETFKYDYPIVRGFKRKLSHKPKNPNKEKISRIDSLRRTKSRLKRLIYANEDLDKFVTLTFKENLTDVQRANYLFHRFIDRLKDQKGSHIKYISVIEFQKRGAIHYHCLINIPYTDNKELSHIWKHGFIGINKIEGKNMFGYLSKYVMKNQFDSRLAGKKKYFHSRNVNQPIIQTGKNHEQIKAFVLKKTGIDIDTKKPEHEKEYDDQKTRRKIKYKLFTGNGSL